MPEYVLMGELSVQGARNAKDTVKRSRAARETFAGMGVNAREWFFTLGQYDVVLTVDAPDDETLTRAAVALAIQGNLRTTTLRGFSEKEIKVVLRGVPECWSGVTEAVSSRSTRSPGCIPNPRHRKLSNRRRNERRH